MSKNILLTSIGAKVSLIRCVKEAIENVDTAIKLVACDSSDKAIGSYFADIFFKIEALDKLDFKLLLKYINQYNIGYIIPTRDGELGFFAHHKKELKKQHFKIRF